MRVLGWGNENEWTNDRKEEKMEMIILLLILLLDLNCFNVIITTALLFHLFDRAWYLHSHIGT